MEFFIIFKYFFIKDINIKVKYKILFKIDIINDEKYWYSLFYSYMDLNGE